MAASRDTLHSRLSACTPKGTTLHYHHLSTPPARCAALYNPPPHTEPEKTFCESHLLLVSVPHELRLIAIYAIELQIYTTRSLTTIFVSKADSTGYASLLSLPKTSGSLLQSVTRTFVSWIVRHRHRKDRKLVVSLFARAQNQYLFPGSSENAEKHILSDRQLVKWWCKTLDGVLREYNAPDTSTSSSKDTSASTSATLDDTVSSRAHLIVPGHDSLETTAFFPPSYRSDPSTSKRWTPSHPLRDLTPYPSAPPRSQIPHFPDDPKARFLNTLDEEISGVPAHSSQSSSFTASFGSPKKRDAGGEEKYASPSKRGRGVWKSVKTLDQFWELMAYRQECCAGRLVGFLWLVFTPEGLPDTARKLFADGAATMEKPLASSGSGSVNANEKGRGLKSPAPKKKTKRKELKRKIPLTGPIIPRQPRIKGTAPSISNLKIDGTSTYASLDIPLILPQKTYDRSHELLLRLDFAGKDTAANSTEMWIREVGVLGGVKEWGRVIEGVMDVPATVANTAVPAPGGINVLAVKRRSTVGVEGVQGVNAAAFTANGLAPSTSDVGPQVQPLVNMLAPGLVRKKRPADQIDPASSAETGSGINMLGAGLVRKKAKN